MTQRDSDRRDDVTTPGYIAKHCHGSPPKPPAIPREWSAHLDTLQFVDPDAHAGACRTYGVCPMCQGSACRSCDQRGTWDGHRDHVIDSILADLSESL